ncbi:MAG: FAD-binding oxidoreductase [Gemmatimonadaceae bacterium]
MPIPIPDSIVRRDFAARAIYSEAAGIARCIPAAVAVPRRPEDVQELVELAITESTPLVPHGSGSGMAGGAVGTGIIVDLSRMQHLSDIDVSMRRVFAGPGALRSAIEAAARKHGLTFPVDPSSGAFCTVGGMAATNAAGAHSLKVGSTRRWVMALDCIFADGTRGVVRRGERPPDIPAIRRFLAEVHPAIVSTEAKELAHLSVRKESSGYALHDYARSGDLVDLLVGSEGTLAIFTGVELALTPVACGTSSVLAAFASLDDAFSGAELAREAKASTCELLDRTFLDLVVSRIGGAEIPAATEAVLLAELEGSDDVEAAAAATALSEIFRRAGGTYARVALGHAEEASLWSLRHAASPILSALDPSLRSMQFIEDGAFPPGQVASYVRGVRKALGGRGIRGVIFGHAGDAHIHVNPLVDVSQRGWRDRVSSLLDEVADLTSQLGGTLTGEHGDGRLRTPLLERVWSERARSLFAAVKRSFDPDGLLNPGVKVPLPHQSPLTDIKYDPTLPPLPPEVRAALDSVERDRAWHRFRLSLIPGSE